jgi:GSCFA family protein/polysaccharide biosynthesis acetyltransferase WcbI-like protein
VKIFVTGSCQAASLANCLAVMLPSIRVELVPFPIDAETLAGDDDVIVRQRNRRSDWGLRPHRDNEFLYPRIFFNAFHPDLVYIAGPAGSPTPPLGDFHSSLVLYGWDRGLSVAATARLFSEPVYERLGFFRCWDAAKHTVLEEGRAIDFPLDALFARWERLGCFMHASNHPALTVMADLAREVVRAAGLPLAVPAPEYYLGDPMMHMAVWPVYPEIGARLGLPGAYAFKMAQPADRTTPAILDLEEFIERSFEAYAVLSPRALTCPRLDHPAYCDLETIASSAAPPSSNGDAERPARPRPRGGSPYEDLPPSRFWRRAVERVPPAQVDPVGPSPFPIGRGTRIATAGSCFAQSMSRVLERYGYDYYVAEPAPPHFSPEQARTAGYGIFSTRSGNLYTARALLQLFDRAYGELVPHDSAWLRPDGRYADPFRPQIEPDGFATVAELVAARETHLAAVRSMFEQLGILIFTLGLTEAWRATIDGAVFPLAPGVTAGETDPARYEFVNFSAAEVRDDLAAFLARLKHVNPDAKTVLTVSPQPPIATYEPRHVLVSATYTKAALRVAADEIERTHPDVWYFPGYELVASAFNRGAYFARDLRTVTPEGVEHVMRLFLEHGARDEQEPAALDERMVEENRANLEIVCDEEAIAYDGAAEPASGQRGAGTLPWAEYKQFLTYELPEIVPMPVPRLPGTRRMDPLERSSMRAPVEATLPRSMRTRTIVSVPCTITNDGAVALATGEPNPVFLCYRWYDDRDLPTEVGHSIHTPLPAALEPGAALSVPMRIATPQHAGRYRLRVAVLQSEVAWFDDVDPGNGIDVSVEVAERTTARALG